MTPLRVTGAWVQLLADWLDHQRLPAPGVRALLGSRRPADTVPITLWTELLEQALQMRPELTAPALAVGALVEPRHLGVLGYLILSSSTLGEAMQAYSRYERLFYGADLASVEVESSNVRLCWPASASTGKLADTVAIAALVAFQRRLLGNLFVLESVSFAFAPPDQPQERQAYDAFFACEVHFSAAETAVVLPLESLARPLPGSDPDLRALLDGQAQALLRAAPDTGEIDRAVQQALIRCLPEGRVTLARIAVQLHLSVRSLQRRLAEREICWRQLLDQTREQLASEYLADASLSATDIAFLLGFSEQSAFNRAFRRWTGSSPERYRRRLASVQEM
ncbi:AraC family transcriptional regulator ligand-binding domain-containing protein [uncultured Halopseudomonas sp.]|uniref:AraC family transcriptional regulator n=1 Tax=uncultured Halopseudomonas sp. TaxID=2901193 RepID=UPI0030EC3129|tara:strand:- start:9078 stop:10088 length:1011 start_codon:yes stop_codon:yes gene_type:complete